MKKDTIDFLNPQKNKYIFRKNSNKGEISQVLLIHQLDNQNNM